ncbi:MAG TPA: glycosyltransferase family 4 protein [Actinomycetota bacterium]
MKIALIAPPWIAVPPPGYGGIEWVVALLADGLVDRGHDVTLFAAGGSVSKARIVSPAGPAPGPLAIGDTLLETVHAFGALEHPERFDLIHDHTSLVALAMAARGDTPVVHTIHGLITEPYANWYRSLTDRVHYVSISDSQRAPAPDLSYAGRVYNGIHLADYPFRAEKEDFLLFVGRADPAKGAREAVVAAKKAGLPLTLAVAIKKREERRYWKEQVVPELTGDETVLAEIPIEQKADLMGRARAVLFPITWPEPFGLVMAEANACGTPVIAFPNGAAPEVIADGVSGFIVPDAERMAEAVTRATEIDPNACRVRVEEHFSAARMVAGYEEVFDRVLAG